jgi:hypothetical protein
MRGQRRPREKNHTMKVEFVKFVVTDDYVQAMFKKAKDGLFDDERTIFARKFITASFHELGEDAAKAAVEEWLDANSVDIVEGDGVETYNEVVLL